MHRNDIGGELFGYVSSRWVRLFIGIDRSTGRCAVYNGGWDLINLVGFVDGENIRLRILNRGWFKTKVLLTMEDNELLLETGNKFGDILRPVFGSEAYNESNFRDK